MVQATQQYIVIVMSRCKGPVITGEGATKRENFESKTFCAPPPPLPPRNKVELLVPPLHFKGMETFCPPPTAWLKNQESCIETMPPLSPRLNFSNPPFRRSKTRLVPPFLFSSHPPPPPPLLVTNARSLTYVGKLASDLCRN